MIASDSDDGAIAGRKPHQRSDAAALHYISPFSRSHHVGELTIPSLLTLHTLHAHHYITITNLSRSTTSSREFHHHPPNLHRGPLTRPPRTTPSSPAHTPSFQLQSAHLLSYSHLWSNAGAGADARAGWDIRFTFTVRVRVEIRVTARVRAKARARARVQVR